MREGFGADVTVSHFLQTVVANGRRGGQALMNADDYVAELKKENEGPRLRVAVVDVLHRLEIIQKLGGKGKLLFDLLPQDTQTDGRPQTLPEYNLGIAVNRDKPQW